MIMNKKSIQMRKGFTLIEILIAVAIVSIVIMSAMQLYGEVVQHQKRIEFSRELSEEARFTMERLVNEVRQGTVDYAEYWNQKQGGEGCGADLNGDGDVVGETGTLNNDIYESDTYGDYGACYQFYAASFYDGNRDGVSAFFDYAFNGEERFALEHMGSNGDENAIGGVDWDGDGGGDAWVGELYLINAEGTEKTILRRRPNDNTVGGASSNSCFASGRFDTGNAETRDDYCRLEMLKMVAIDTDTDGKVDTWDCAEEYKPVDKRVDDPDTDVGRQVCGVDLNEWDDYFQPVTPPNIHITDLKFFVAPVEDPYKAYEEEDVVRMQPHVTIVMSAEVPYKQASYLPGEAPQITLQTTVAARVFDEVTLYNDF